MRILITGNMGYVGSVLVPHLRRVLPDAELIGFDAGFFAGKLTSAGLPPETCLDAQLFGDIRDLPPAILGGVDRVVHLAAISNDPMGNRFAHVTDAVNHKASLRLAHLARDAGVGGFVFASSCSVYGQGGEDARRETDATDPLTAYASSKTETEAGLRGMELDRMRVTCLRFATACGMSPRLRLDLVLNDFVACALSSGEITVLSDGTPLRPLIDVRDMARAIEWALTARHEGPPFLVVNAGCDCGNYQVRDLAAAVAEAVPGTRIRINTEAPADKRSYRVGFSLFARLAPDHQPEIRLTDSVNGLVEGLRASGFRDRDFRNSGWMRLAVLDRLVAAGGIGPDLRRLIA